MSDVTAPSSDSSTTRRPSRVVHDLMDLLASMRFAIALLTVICIASVIGTVVKQHEPLSNYVNQFGPFWADVFGKVGLYNVYSAWWFLLILAFLVVSTSLCIARNTPKILSDLRNAKESLREQSLQAFHHKDQAVVNEAARAAQDRIAKLLLTKGWRVKAQTRSNGVMLAARRGASNKLGYIAAHSAIVLICIGGLLDGDLIIKAQMGLQGKTAFRGGGMVRDVSANHRLGPDTPTFRANLLVPEGERANTAIISTSDGVVLQELPFDVELKKFIVEYYNTGMPKLFASQIVIHDRQTGQAIPTTVEVNKPAFHRGVAIYQSSFDDGGSSVTLRAVPMALGTQPFEVKGQIGGNTVLTNQTHPEEKLTLEFTGLRVINVENFAQEDSGAGSSTDVRKVDLQSPLKSLGEHLGSGVKVQSHKDLRNIGPSISYKLRDSAGQAREFHNYMLPVNLDGHPVFLVGVRDSPAENFQYIRLPADDKGSLDDYNRLREALFDPAQRKLAIERYVAQTAPRDKPEAIEQLRTVAERTMNLFVGTSADSPEDKPLGGLAGMSRSLERHVPAAERERVSKSLLNILNSCLFELLNLSRTQAGLSVLSDHPDTQAFLNQSVIALSDSFFYPAPVMFMLTDFKQVQASVFQVARAPGKTLVYAGAVALIIGVFMMLYVRERRLWVWLTPDDTHMGTKITTAMSTTRRTLDADAEFEALKSALLQLDTKLNPS